MHRVRELQKETAAYLALRRNGLFGCTRHADQNDRDRAHEQYSDHTDLLLNAQRYHKYQRGQHPQAQDDKQSYADSKYQGGHTSERRRERRVRESMM